MNSESVFDFKSSQVTDYLFRYHEKFVCHMILKDNDNNSDRRVIQHNYIYITLCIIGGGRAGCITLCIIGGGRAGCFALV